MRAGDPESPSARQLAAALLPAGSLLDPVEACGNPVGVDLQVVDGAVRRRDQIGAPYREWIEPKLAGHDVEERLEGVPRVDRAVPAHRAAGRRVGVDAIAAVFHRRHRVERVQQGAGVEDRDQAIAAVRATALDDLTVDRSDFAALLETDLQPDVGLGPTAMGEEALLARELHLHGPAGGACEQCSDHLEVEWLDPVAETAAD